MIRKLAAALALLLGLAQVSSAQIYPMGRLPFPVTGGGTLSPIGNQTVETAQDNPGGIYMTGSYFTAPATGSYAGTFHLYCAGGGEGVYVGIYATSSGSASGQPLLASAGPFVCSNSTGAWVTASISFGAVSGTLYYFGMSGADSGWHPYYNTSAPANSSAYGSYTYTGSMPSTAPTLTNTTSLYSEYITNP
jgi:hypothetical protein